MLFHIPIKNITNELYAKDIRRKVRSAHNTRGRAGEPLCQPPYGYMKDPQDKKHWIVDPDAAAAEYLLDDADRFAEVLARKSNTEQETERINAQAELRKSEMRLEMIPKLLKNLYEEKVIGKTKEDDYNILSAEYASERETLKKKVLALRKKLGDN